MAIRIRADAALLPGGWSRNVLVTVDGTGRIASVAAGFGEAGAPDGHDVAVPVLLPALANLHSHTFQRAMAGLTETRGPSGRDSFWTWRELMYRFLGVLSPDDVEAVAAFAFMEMLEAGISAVAEFHYLHHAPGGVPYDDAGELSMRIAAGASSSGIGLTLLPVFYRQGGLDGRPLQGGQLRFRSDRTGYDSLLDRAGSAIAPLGSDARLGIAPHSLRAAPRQDIAALACLMPEAPFHLHIAEQEGEVAEVVEATGRRPVAGLLEDFDVAPRWCLVHATQMTPEETASLARTGAVAGLCPVTEASLGDGIFDAVRYLGAGGAFGIGSDSNIRISGAEELRQLEYSQRLRDRARVLLAADGRSVGRTLYEGALQGGARALGRDAGAIRPGAWADLAALDPARFAGSGAGDGLLDGWIFTGGNDAVTDVWSAGRHVVRSGRHIRRDAVEARYRTALAGMLDRL